MPVPDFAEVVPGRPLKAPRFPAVVKPAERDYSDGITLRSFVRDRRQLDARIASIRARSDESLIVESFIPGQDLYVFAVEMGGSLKIRPAQILATNVRASDPRSMAVQALKHNAVYRKRLGARPGAGKPQPAADRTIAQGMYGVCGLHCDCGLAGLICSQMGVICCH